MVTANALSFIREEKPDFAFVYLGLTDSAGHQYGWMGEEYLQACASLWMKYKSLRKALWMNTQL